MLIVFGLTHPAVVLAAPVPGEDQGPDGDDHRPAIAGFWWQGLYYLPPPPIHFIYKFPWTLGLARLAGHHHLRHDLRLAADGPGAGHRVHLDADPDQHRRRRLHLGVRAVPGAAARRLRADRRAPVPARDDLPDHAGAARGRTARLRHVPAALVPGHQAGRTTSGGCRPVRGAGHGAAAGRHPARHHDDGDGRRRARLRREQAPRLAARAQDHRRRHLGLRRSSSPSSSARSCSTTSTSAPDRSWQQEYPRPTGRPARIDRLPTRAEETRCASTQSCSTTAAR